MRISLLILAFTCSLVIASDLGNPVSSDIQEELNAIGAELEKAALSNDYKSILKHYSDDVIVMADFQEPIRSKKSLKAIYEKEAQRMLRYHSISGTAEKRWEVNGYIYEYGSFGMTVSSRDEKKPSGYFGSYFQIWERSDSTYKLKYIIWNLDHYPN
jgi:ketosteroid isomerase-like protein